MARTTTLKSPKAPLDERIEQALLHGLKEGGIQAKVEIEPVPQTKLHRVWVIAGKFKNLRISERQDLVWRILSQVLDPDEQLRISMVYTLTRPELAGRDE